MVDMDTVKIKNRRKKIRIRDERFQNFNNKGT
jgi:hypothetical protein